MAQVHPWPPRLRAAGVRLEAVRQEEPDAALVLRRLLRLPRAPPPRRRRQSLRARSKLGDATTEIRPPNFANGQRLRGGGSPLPHPLRPCTTPYSPTPLHYRLASERRCCSGRRWAPLPEVDDASVRQKIAEATGGARTPRGRTDKTRSGPRHVPVGHGSRPGGGLRCGSPPRGQRKGRNGPPWC